MHLFINVQRVVLSEALPGESVVVQTADTGYISDLIIENTDGLTAGEFADVLAARVNASRRDLVAVAEHAANAVTLVSLAQSARDLQFRVTYGDDVVIASPIIKNVAMVVDSPVIVTQSQTSPVVAAVIGASTGALVSALLGRGKEANNGL